MTFTVTYRAKDGALREECVEAASRAECVAECRRRGIAPKGIKEGRSGKSAASPSGSPSQRRLTGNAAILAAVVLAAVGVGVWRWMATAREDARPPVEKPAKSKVEKPQQPRPKQGRTSPSAKVENPVPSATDGGKVDATPPKEVRMYNGQRVVRVDATTNSAGMLVERLYTADGKKHRLTHFPPPVFKHASDELLATFISTPQGAEMPPLPDLSRENMEEQFRKSLEDEIEIKPDDPEHIKDLKAKVMIVRENMKEMLSEGRSFADVLEETRRTMNENVEIRSRAMVQYHELLRKGHADDAEKLRLKMNEVLTQMGIEEIAPHQPGNGRQKKGETVK